MKKIIAHMLVCVLIFTTLQGVTFGAIKNNTPYSFAVIEKILSEESSGLVINSRGSSHTETALAKWDIATIGKYELRYYVEAKQGADTISKRVDLAFDAKGTQIDLAVNTYSEQNTTPSSISTVPDPITGYSIRDINNSTNVWETSAITANSIKKTFLRGNTVARSDKEFNLIVNDVRMAIGNKTENLQLKMKLDGDMIYVYTNGIAEGNVTRFELWFDGQKVTQQEVFNGPKGYSITPTHLYMDGSDLKSMTTLDNPQDIKPGSKPGIKLTFRKPKLVNEKGIFEEITANTAKEITLLIGPEYTLDTVSDGIRMDIEPVANGNVKVDLVNNHPAAVQGEVDSNGNEMLSLYLASDVTGLPNYVIEWDILEPSMIVNGSFEYGSTGSKYWPKNKGYTYLNYTISKTNDNQAKLIIQPYNIKAKATYSIYIGTKEDSFTNEAQVIYEYDPNKTDNNTITTIVPVQNVSYFKIEVEINEHLFKSQIVKYNPSEYDAIPEVTEIKSIDNIYVVPNEQSDLAQPQAVGFDIEWSAPTGLSSILANGDLYYELLLRKDKDDLDPILKTSNATSDNYATYSKIFKVSLDAQGKVIVTPAKGTAGGDNNSTPNLRYSSTNQSFTMESVSLKNFGKNDNWEQVVINENHLDVLSGDYLNGATVSDSLGDRSIPGVFYLSFRTVFVSNDATKNIVYSAESNMTSIALDTVEEIVPVPSAVTTVDTSTNDVISEKVTFDLVDVKDYVKKMLEPAMAFLYKDNNKTTGRYSGTYEMYLYQEDAKLNDTIKEVEKGKVIPREITTGSQLNLELIKDGKTDIQRLKDGEVVPITIPIESLRGIGSGNFEIVGLEANQVYYIKVRVKLSPWRDNISNKLDPRYSIFSKEVTFTTTTTPIPPSSDDKVPPAPEDLWIVSQPNNTSVILGWAPAEFEEDSDITKTYYEFIRTNKKLTDKETSKSVEDLVAADEHRVGFRSNSPTENEPYMNTYTYKNKVWKRLSPDQPASEFKLTDEALNPNAVYYYYVRTVCVIDGEGIKSSWIMIPVTTSPVDKPINLKVEVEEDYSHDTTEEIVVSFDAPIPDGADVPGDYDFEIAVKGEMDDDYSTTKYKVKKIAVSTTNDTTPIGYTHYVYKIIGLKSNKKYEIKVRIVDKTQILVDGEEYPRSLYSDKVSARTEYDEEDQIKNDKFDDYLESFDSQTELLKRQPYWVVEEGSTYKYRESYATSLVGATNIYELVAEKDASELYYYMPAQTIYAANSKNTVLKVKLGDATISVRPKTLTEENEVIDEAIQEVNDLEIKNYYIGFHFTSDKHDGGTSINGEKILSPEITVDMEVVYMEEKENIIEDDIMMELADLITKHRNKVIDKLEVKIDKGSIDDDTLSEIIDEAIDDIKEEHAKEVKSILKSEKDSIETIEVIEQAVLITMPLESSSAEAYYYYGNRWIEANSFAMGGNFTIEADKLGTYIFTGMTALINTVPSLAPYQSFISTYNLNDFFTLTATGITQKATKEQLYSAVARVLGAARGTDYILFLKGKNINGVTSIGTNYAIRQDQAIYVMMQAYERLHNRKVNAITIKNRQSVKNIGAFQAPYRSYVYAAVELKIVDNPNARVLPSKELTAEEVIKMLYKVQVR